MLIKRIDEFNEQLTTGLDEPSLGGKFTGQEINGDVDLKAVFGGKVSSKNNPFQVDAIVDDYTDAVVDPLPVVLTVGINYGQVATGHFTRKTQMRSGLNKLNGIFPDSKGRAPLISDQYHLVAWNLFPILSPQPWGDYNFNGLEEALVIWRWGYANWPQLSMKLITAIAPQVVVFHGINNAVPYHGMMLADTIRPRATDDYPRVVFCGNLARVTSVTTAKTTVEIRPPPISRIHVHQVNDE